MILLATKMFLKLYTESIYKSYKFSVVISCTKYAKESYRRLSLK